MKNLVLVLSISFSLGQLAYSAQSSVSTDVPAKFSGAFDVSCDGDSDFSQINTSMGIAKHSREVIFINAKMGRTPVGSKEAMLVQIYAKEKSTDVETDAVGSFWLPVAGPDDDLKQVGWDFGFNETQIFYNFSGKNQNPRGVSLVGRSAGEIVAGVVAGAEYQKETLVVTTLDIIRSESLTVQNDGSLLYRYELEGKRNFASDAQIAAAMNKVTFLRKVGVRNKINDLMKLAPEVLVKGECQLTPIAGR